MDNSFLKTGPYSDQCATHIIKLFVVFLLLCSLMVCANNQVHYDPMVVFVCLHIALPHYHHNADLSEAIELLKCFSDISCLEWMFKIKSVFLIIYHSIYGTWCIQLTHYSYDDCVNTCTLSYYLHQIGSMTHLSSLRVMSWNNGTHCMSVYILISLCIVLYGFLYINSLYYLWPRLCNAL